MENHTKHSNASLKAAADRAAAGPHPYGIILCPCGNRAHDKPYLPDFSERTICTPHGEHA